jgi:hypothetical protein
VTQELNICLANGLPHIDRAVVLALGSGHREVGRDEVRWTGNPEEHIIAPPCGRVNTSMTALYRNRGTRGGTGGTLEESTLRPLPERVGLD